MKPLMESPMLDCEAVMRQLWDYLDGELTTSRMAAMQAHLDVCKRCEPQLEFKREFLVALSAARAETTPDSTLRDRVVTRLRGMGFTA